MNNKLSPKLSCRSGFLSTIGTTVLILGACVGSAWADADSIARGQSIWKDKAGCAGCHGWAGDGNGGLHHEGHALSLRATELDHDQIRMTIQCGRPGTPMPHFDRFAYTDKRCYGATQEELGDNTPDRGPTTLQAHEIDDLADYVAFKLKGSGPVTRAQCLAYYNERSSSTCDRYLDR